MKPRTAWPFAIAGLLAIPIAADLALLHFGSADPSAAIEPDYYRKALDWDRAQALQARSDSLGWKASVAATPAPGGRLAVQVVLRDRRGAAMRDASVRVSAFAIARSSDVYSADLALLPLALHAGRPEDRPHAGAPGVYSGTWLGSRAGIWEFRIEARRGEEVFLDSQRLEVPAGSPP